MALALQRVSVTGAGLTAGLRWVGTALSAGATTRLTSAQVVRGFTAAASSLRTASVSSRSSSLVPATFRSVRVGVSHAGWRAGCRVPRPAMTMSTGPTASPATTPASKAASDSVSPAAAAGGKAGEELGAASKRPAWSDHATTQVHLAARDKLLLVVTFMFPPNAIPDSVGHGTLNMAWGRIRIAIATLAMLVMLGYSEHAIRLGRVARDSGEESLYNDPSALRQNEVRKARYALHQAELAQEKADKA
eukprot:m.213239 g.213239  ORF g.213239 m.213239 type:complete len:248 (+) comp18602_c0_seq5:203-946(+)